MDAEKPVDGRRKSLVDKEESWASSEIQKTMLHCRLGGGTMQKILIVEDDTDIQDILKNHLIDAGYEVAVASDGVAGIAMLMIQSTLCC